MPTKPSAAALPTHEELHAFLTRHYRINAQDPTKTFPFWQELQISSPPFSNLLVQDLREHCRKTLREIDDELRIFREIGLKGDVNRKVDCPKSSDLFQIAGANVEPQQRVKTCMRMVGITQGDVEVSLEITNYNEWLNGHVADFGALPNVCRFLGLNQTWVARGPTAYSLVMGDGIEPWWLRPWRFACHDAQHLFSQAEQIVIRMSEERIEDASYSDLAPLLHWRMDIDPPGYDFEAFWSAWQSNPKLINLGIPKVLERANRECLKNPRQIPPEHPRSSEHRKEIVPDGDPIPSFLPWLFECRMCFNSGNPTFQRTFTPDTWATLQWILSFYIQNGIPEGKKLSLPLGRRPTSADVLALQNWLRMPPDGNPRLSSAQGHGGSPTPKHSPAPSILPSEKDKPTRGRPKNDKK